ncbi:MAG: ATP-binding protein [bacterium]|nr:ATP-binding protein [bacterium]
MFSRNILQVLELWAASGNRKPLILRGARQVGKTVAVKLFAHGFDRFVCVNLDTPGEGDIFLRGLPVEDVFQAICLRQRVKANSGRTLLFLDEIQSCPEAVEYLRYFHEKLPDVYVIAAGSLLEIALHEKHISFPVGRAEHLFMYPLSFGEFLNAIKAEEALDAIKTFPFPPYAYDTLLQLFHRYVLIGGMPEVVANYAETKDIIGLSGIYNSLLTSFEDDIGKYARNPTAATVLRHCIETAPFQAGKRIKFAGFGQSNYRSREVGEALRTLQRAMLIYLLYPSSSVEPPIMPNMKKSPRLQFLDTGLLNYYAGLQDQVLQHRDLHAFYRGLVAEHIVGQELLCIDPNTRKKHCFWTREKPQSAAEVDFLLLHGSNVIPVEVKAGKAGTLRSLHQFIDNSTCRHAVRLYGGPVDSQQTCTAAGTPFELLNMPYFLTSQIHKYVDWMMSQ